MTAKDTYHEMKFDEAEARRRRIGELLDLLVEKETEIDALKAEVKLLRQPAKSKKQPPIHEGQMRIGE
jgi:hypothetical protein